ncbi:MaoC family dehydratase N-terminal domain-containing protein [Aquamicrobium sp. LC103]|uniref:FAS1-like dehydratase domain-containing protein n=1 Tax=Aquamicrobium sp. LC103 TaxID=1120658 RepID=UPI00063E86D0|nr:MaoC family dehydratase N-terminal domain-containing protein [Aquamicrobium sp. LC103]TKT74524.1 MaoC family dehydratase [Aquamicrobium sp. LC103]
MIVDLQPLVGAVFARKVGAEPVSEVGIRRYVEAHELESPLFHDRAQAREAGHNDIIAPWSMLLTMAMGAYWKPGDPTIEPGMWPPFAWGELSLPGGEMVTSEVGLEFFEPLQLGDIIHSEYRIARVTPKNTKVGSGDFIDFEINFTNQHGKTIAVERCTVYRYMPHGHGEDVANG